MSDPKDRLIIALDYPDLPAALEMARLVGPEVGMLKIGLELFNSAGPKAVLAVREMGARVFYDSKFSDIPNTVAGAAAAVARMGVSMFNVHALGGRTMMEAARTAASEAASEAGFPAPIVIGVTVVTSLSDGEVKEELGIPADAGETAIRLAVLAKEAGLDGVVAAVSEVREIRRVCGKEFLVVTPGIRPAWAQVDDQSRFATPGQAIEAGSDYLVVGRPVTRAEDPVEAVTAIVSEMASACAR
jgi:orotidine-5'-phosphate decarboxylase